MSKTISGENGLGRAEKRERLNALLATDQADLNRNRTKTISGENGLGRAENSNEKIRLSGFSHESFVDGPGIRVVVFVQGCENACEHCHNPESWDISAGEEHSVREVIKMIKDAAGTSQRRNNTTAGMGMPAVPRDARKKDSLTREIQGVTFSGGEPFLQASALVKIATAVKRLGLDITVYTGYTYEELTMHRNEDIQALLALADFLIDGSYIHKLRDIGLKFRGSKNQRVIDMNKTRKAGQVVEFI